MESDLYQYSNLEIHDVKEVYFASTIQYSITYKGKEYCLRKHENSNGGETLIETEYGWEDLYDDSHGDIGNELIEMIWEGTFD